MRYLFVLSMVLASVATGAATAVEPALQVTVEGIDANGAITDDYALCLATKDGKSEKTGKNRVPAIAWKGVPEGTKSFAVFMIDPDVPADLSTLNVEGKVIADTEKRQDFYHYGVVNIAPAASMLTEASAEKALKLTNDLGLHKYVSPANAFGGPCPPWNDERLHHYRFVVMALDVASLTLPKSATVKDALAATHGHVLAQGEQVGTYTLNATLR